MEEVQPVVTPRPKRGREMRSRLLPSDMLETMRSFSAKHTLLDEDLKKAREDKTEVYYEGYVDGKKYLVPDSNLEAMKDMINLKMRPRKSTRYKHQTSYDLGDYDHFQTKINKLLSKIDIVKKALSDDDISEQESEPKNKHSITSNEKSETSEMTSVVKEDDDNSESKESEEKQKVEEGEQYSGNKPTVTHPESEEYHLRFLISGHLKKDENPIYIIQEYDGKFNIFEDQKADFTSSQKEGNVDIFISGKMYVDNILEESNGAPVFLNTKPNKIAIDMNKSKIFYDYFEGGYDMESADISLRGEFIKSKFTQKITPLLSIGIKQKNSTVATTISKNEGKTTNIANTPSTIIVYTKASYSTPFSENTTNENSNNSKQTKDDNINPKTSSMLLHEITKNTSIHAKSQNQGIPIWKPLLAEKKTKMLIQENTLISNKLPNFENLNSQEKKRDSLSNGYLVTGSNITLPKYCDPNRERDPMAQKGLSFFFIGNSMYKSKFKNRNKSGTRAKDEILKSKNNKHNRNTKQKVTFM